MSLKPLGGEIEHDEEKVMKYNSKETMEYIFLYFFIWSFIFFFQVYTFF